MEIKTIIYLEFNTIDRMVQQIIFRVLNSPKSILFMIVGGIIGWNLTHDIFGILFGVIAGAYLSYNI